MPGNCWKDQPELSISWFKHYRLRVIAWYAKAFKKVARYYKELFREDPVSAGGGSTSWRH